MTKGIKVLITALLVLVGGLAGVSGFLYAKNLNLQKSKTDTSTTADTSATAKKITTDSATGANGQTSTAATASSAVTEPAPAGNRPSAPSDTYTIQQGETLFSIGKKLDVNWTQLAEANGITDANKIKAGQVLVVPKNNQVNFTVNSAKAAELQKAADTGKYAFRLSALDTAKSDSPSVYGLATTDTFKETKVDATAGSATITATHESKIYDIKLTQPATKGEKGIWAIESIKPVSS